MQTIAQKILASTGLQLSINARTFLVQSSDQGTSLSVVLTDSHGNRYSVASVGTGFKATPAAGFVKIEVSATVDTNVQLIVSDGDVDIQNNQQFATISNGTANPVPVAIQGGVNLTATNVGINNTAGNPVPVSLVSEPGAPLPVVSVPTATTATDLAAVAVGTAGAALLAAGATRKGFRVRNVGAGKIGLTAAAATTFAAAAVVLNPGDVWNETDAPAAAWYAVSDTGSTAALQVVA